MEKMNALTPVIILGEQNRLHKLFELFITLPILIRQMF